MGRKPSCILKKKQVVRYLYAWKIINMDCDNVNPPSWNIDDWMHLFLEVVVSGTPPRIVVDSAMLSCVISFPAKSHVRDVKQK